MHVMAAPRRAREQWRRGERVSMMLRPHSGSVRSEEARFRRAARADRGGDDDMRGHALRCITGGANLHRQGVEHACSASETTRCGVVEVVSNRSWSAFDRLAVSAPVSRSEAHRHRRARASPGAFRALAHEIGADLSQIAASRCLHATKASLWPLRRRRRDQAMLVHRAAARANVRRLHRVSHHKCKSLTPVHPTMRTPPGAPNQHIRARASRSPAEAAAPRQSHRSIPPHFPP